MFIFDHHATSHITSSFCQRTHRDNFLSSLYMLTESRLTSKLSHPNIWTLWHQYSVQTTEESPVLHIRLFSWTMFVGLSSDIYIVLLISICFIHLSLHLSVKVCSWLLNLKLMSKSATLFSASCW